ncbi:MAG: hypothetical protein NVSMB19_19330 [Vulcanimicrobiaceae bacterium]
MRNFLAGALVAGLALSTTAPTLAMKEKMMSPKCGAGDMAVMVDPKTKMYHAMTDKKSHMVMVKSHDKTMMMCKSKADGMGAKMMENGKAAM